MSRPAHFLEGKAVRRAWPFPVSVDSKGRVTRTLPPKQPKREQLPALF